MTIDTKSKILEIASRLFAENGYNGTSVRDIAQEADVNIASINYHFKNKQTLYWVVTTSSHQWLADNVERVSKETETTEDLCMGLYDFLIENSHSVKNAFLMFLSGSIPEIDEETLNDLSSQKDVGPPGGQFIFEKIQKEFGDELPAAGIKWAVKNIFTNIIHFAIMQQTSHCRMIYKDHPDFQPEAFRTNMKYNIRSAIEFLVNHKEQWKS